MCARNTVQGPPGIGLVASHGSVVSVAQGGCDSQRGALRCGKIGLSAAAPAQ